MDGRSHAGPMDFEYQNGTGPVDARSPFAQVSGNHQRSFASLADDQNATRKRGLRQAFGSPSKPIPPSLRPPQSQPHLFTQQAIPQSPSRYAGGATPFSLKTSTIFSTPRRFDAESSGGETPRSPEQSLIDSDATPDHSALNFRNSPVKFDAGSMPVFAAGNTATNKLQEEEKGKRRDSWWSRAFTSSPGRGEIARGVYSDKVVKKVAKKRRAESLKQMMRRNNSVSDSEESRPPSPTKAKKKSSRWGTRKVSGTEDAPPPPAPKGSLAAFFEFLTANPTLPQILSWYAQLTLNFFLISSLIYMLYSFYATIRSDIDKKSTEAVSELMAEMAACARQYTENRCEPSTRVPAMQTVCENWEKCMRQDVKALGRAKISVGMWAEIFNGFIEPISWKAMIFTFVIIFGCIALSNLPFSMIRHRAEQQQAAANHHHYYGTGPPGIAPPPTPHRTFSGDVPQYFGDLEPAPSPVKGVLDGRNSPVKQLQFR